MNAVQWFRAAFPRVLAFHVPNGEKRDRRTAELLQRMGVLPGVGDWLMFPAGVKICFEFKRKKGGVQDADQVRFERMWKRIGGVYHVVNNLEDFQALCIGYCFATEGPPEPTEPVTVPWA
jgi:hypothetical protein